MWGCSCSTLLIRFGFALMIAVAVSLLDILPAYAVFGALVLAVAAWAIYGYLHENSFDRAFRAQAVRRGIVTALLVFLVVAAVVALDYGATLEDRDEGGSLLWNVAGIAMFLTFLVVLFAPDWLRKLTKRSRGPEPAPTTGNNPDERLP